MKIVFFLKKTKFCQFQQWKEKLWFFVEKSFGWVFKIAFYVSMSKFRTNLLFEKNFILFGHWEKLLRCSVEVFSVGLSKLHPTCRHRFLRKSSFLGMKRIFFHHHRTLSEMFASFCRKYFGWVVKTVFYMSIETLSWVFFGKKSFFRHSAIKMRPFCRKFFGGVVEAASCLSTEHCEEKYFFEKTVFFSIIFGHWAKSLRHFAEKISAGLSKQYVTCPSKHCDGMFFEEKKFSFFSRNSAIELWPLLKSFRLSCQSRILRVQRIVSRKFFWKFWVIFGHWELIFRPFIHKISPRLSKLFSTCP